MSGSSFDPFSHFLRPSHPSDTDREVLKLSQLAQLTLVWLGEGPHSLRTLAEGLHAPLDLVLPAVEELARADFLVLPDKGEQIIKLTAKGVAATSS